MLEELEKNGLSLGTLHQLSCKSCLGKSLVNSLRRFDKAALFLELQEIIAFYQESDILDDVDLDYRIKSIDSCERKYIKFYPEMRFEKVFNDILGFRMLLDSYEKLLVGEMPQYFRKVDMSQGKAKDDGYRGVHIYYQPTHFHYPIEIQANTYYDRQINNWLHKYLYKKGYDHAIGRTLRNLYECGKILNEKMFEEALQDVLSDCKKI